jgi:hypothetical protein
MLSLLQQHLVQREMEILSDADLVSWARAALRQEGPVASDPDIVELASIQFGNPRLSEARALLRSAVLRSSPDFDMTAREVQASARAAFIALCARFIAEDLPPYDFCRVVHASESAFDFPAWLGDFYNQCDWCDQHSTRSDFAHLIEYARRFVAENAGAER